jgi:GNAT superfamily N-acetyltransferase
MAGEKSEDGIAAGRQRLDRTERRFWREIWESVPPGVATEHGIEMKAFGPLQASLATSLPGRTMMNLVLGAAEPGAVAEGQVEAAVAWADARGAEPFVPVTPGLPDSGVAQEWLAANGFARGHGWMKFVRDAHPPRFKVAGDVEVVALTSPEQEPFGMIAATGFGLPAWAAAFFADLPGRKSWRCYVACVDGTAQACAAMLVDGAVAELGIAATLGPARGRGCQLALLHRRIVDAAAAGCDTLLIETGEPVPGRPSASYRNILRAGFKEAYLRPNWQRAGESPSRYRHPSLG